MKNLNDLPGFQELTAQEKQTINGGESFLHWAGGLVNRAYRIVADAAINTPDLPTAGQYK